MHPPGEMEQQLDTPRAESARPKAVRGHAGHVSWTWDVVRDAVRLGDSNPDVLGVAGPELRLMARGARECGALHAEDRGVWAEALDALLSGSHEQLYVELRVTQPDASHGWLLARARVAATGPDGEAALVAGSFTDITPTKRAEEERRGVELRVQRLHADERLGVLAGGIAHDFNNLLMGILGNADLIAEDVPEGSPLEALAQDVGALASRAAERCRQMLAYAGKGRLTLRPLSLSELAGDVLGEYQMDLRARVTVSRRLTPGLPPSKGDPAQMVQLIENLVENALEALGDGGGHVHVETGTAELAEEELSLSYGDDDLPGGRYNYVLVRDDGVGMDETVRARLFEPFYTTKFAGRGLGLAAVLGIVRSHLGAVMVESQPGHGTAVTAYFPVLKAIPVEEPSVSRPAKKGGGAILLVDDEAHIRVVGSRVLQHLGYEVRLADSGMAAVRLMEAHGENIACILLDLSMPGMDGRETYNALRAVSGEVPVVLSSGASEQDALDRFSGAQLAGFIQKPYRIEQLRQCLAQAMGTPGAN